MIIKKIKLTNFRQFREKEIELQKKWIIIVAPNARGKSTIIEALYMLSNGESPWEGNHINVIRITDSAKEEDPEFDKITKGTSRIEGLIESDNESASIALFLKSNGGSTMKQFQVEGVSTSRSAFLEQLHCVLFSPDMIDLLMFDPAQRRGFLDTHAPPLFPDYQEINTNYKKILRQRNSLLKSLLGNGRHRSNFQKNSDSGVNMLKYWTQKLIELGTEITATRLEFINSINDASDLYPATITYKPSIRLHELGELAGHSYIKESFEKHLEETKPKERAVGTTLVGPHRDDWFLTVDKRNLNSFGSRGEKRMAIADIILKLNTLLEKKNEKVPVLLLDDITSELDTDNVEVLFKKKLAKGQQIIITTTNIDSIPEEARQTSHIIKL